MRRFQHEALKRTSTHHGLSNMATIGGPEVLIIIVVFFVLFGARRLPELANALGRSKGEFHKGLQEATSLPREAQTIADGKEREQRLWQLEAALQEAIIYKNRVEELQRHGIDPVRLVDSETNQTPAPAPKKVEALMSGHAHCATCRAVLEPDLAFCPACGAEK